MLKRPHKSKVHIANFEEGRRSAQVSLEFDIDCHDEIEVKTSFLRLVFRIILFPVTLPFKILWYVVKDVVKE